MRRPAYHECDMQNRPGARLLRRLGLTALVGIVLLNGGCVFTNPVTYVRNGFKVGPNYKPPKAPVADEWIYADDVRVENRHIQDWWQVFKDPVLDSLIDLAYTQNPTLRTAAARILEARGQQAIAVGDLFAQTQQVIGQYTAVAASQNVANNPTALQPFLGPILPPGTTFPFSNHYANLSGGFNLSWELDFWGRLRRNIESAKANLDVAGANFDDALVILLSDVATNYVQYRIAQQRLKIARENAKIQGDALALVEQQLKGGLGKTTKLDVEQARQILEQTRSTIPALEIVRGQANDTLCTLLGIPPIELEARLGPGPKGGEEPPVNTPTWVAAEVPASLLRQRPDVRSAERQVAAQSALIGAAEADLYPTIFINGALEWGAQDLSKLFESKSFFGNITPNFKWNILNYGRIVNNVHVQDFKTAELVATFQNKVLTAAREVQSSLRGFLRSQEQAESLRRSVKAAEAGLDVGMVQYKAGSITFNTIFNLQTARLQQQDALVVAQGNIALNLITVYRSLGGGWELRLQKEGPLQKPGHGAQAPEIILPPPRPVPPPAPETVLPPPRADLPPAQQEPQFQRGLLVWDDEPVTPGRTQVVAPSSPEKPTDPMAQ